MGNSKVKKLDSLIYFFLILQVSSVAFSISVSSVAFAIAGVLFILRLFLYRDYGRLKTGLELFFLGFVLVELISSVFSNYPAESFLHARRIFLVLVFYMTVFIVRDIDVMKRSVFFVAGIVSLVSVVEIFLYHVKLQLWLGVFQHSTTSGEIKMIALLLLFPFYLNRSLSFKVRLTALFLMAPIYLTFILTFSRGSWLGFIVGLFVVVILGYRWFIPGWVFLLAVFVALFPLKYGSDVAHGPTTIARLEMWKTGILMFQDRPLLGYGDIDLFKIYIKYRPNPPRLERHGHLHNNLIMWLVLFGVVGFAVLVSLFVKMILDAFKILNLFSGVPVLSDVIISGIGIFFAFHSSGLFEWNFGDAEIMTLLWFALGLVFSKAGKG